VVFDSPEAAPVYLVFLLVTPAEQPNLQVVLLGEVAKAAGDADTRDRLRAAATATEVREVLQGRG
ncbi:PTS sugar transporter subunit IIA, partial [bacterium]|nr:PTS sugar transporter subunit IIA [bacterium]